MPMAYNSQKLSPSEDDALKAPQTRAASARAKKEPTRTFSGKMAAKTTAPAFDPTTEAEAEMKSTTTKTKASAKKAATANKSAAAEKLDKKTKKVPAKSDATPKDTEAADGTMIDHGAPKKASAKKNGRRAAAVKGKKGGQKGDDGGADKSEGEDAQSNADDAPDPHEAAKFSESDEKTGLRAPARSKPLQKASSKTKESSKKRSRGKKTLEKTSDDGSDEEMHEDLKERRESAERNLSRSPVIDRLVKSKPSADARPGNASSSSAKRLHDNDDDTASTKESSARIPSGTTFASAEAPELNSAVSQSKGRAKKAKLSGASGVAHSSSSLSSLGRTSKEKLNQSAALPPSVARPTSNGGVRKNVLDDEGETEEREKERQDEEEAEDADKGEEEHQQEYQLSSLPRLKYLSEAERQMTVEKWLLLQGEHVCNEMWKKGMDEINKLREQGQRDRAQIELILRGSHP